MNRPLHRLVALLLIMVLTATGCSPTQPFYLHEDGDLSHYVATVTELENPDVEQISLGGSHTGAAAVDVERRGVQQLPRRDAWKNACRSRCRTARSFAIWVP